MRRKILCMTTGEALQLVHELAAQNTLTRTEAAESDELMQEWVRQDEALAIIEDLLVNEYGVDEEGPKKFSFENLSGQIFECEAPSRFDACLRFINSLGVSIAEVSREE